MNVFVIFTVINGTVFSICHTEEKGAFVSSSAPDSEFLTFNNKEDAQRIADNNSNSEVTYKVKEVNLSTI